MGSGVVPRGGRSWHSVYEPLALGHRSMTNPFSPPPDPPHPNDLTAAAQSKLRAGGTGNADGSFTVDGTSYYLAMAKTGASSFALDAKEVVGGEYWLPIQDAANVVPALKNASFEAPNKFTVPGHPATVKVYVSENSAKDGLCAVFSDT